MVAGLEPLTRVAEIDSGILINVKSPAYGAVGNGTTNDAAAVSSAISAVVALGGGTVFFPVGTYLINTAITTLNSSIGVTLLGNGATITTTLDATLFSLNSVTRFRARGLRFVGNFTGANNLFQRPFNSNPGGTGIEIDHCYFLTITGGFFLADGGGRVNIHDNVFDTMLAPIQFGTGAIKTGISIRDNFFTGSTSVTSDDSIALSGANQDVVITGNVIDQKGTAASGVLHPHAILLESSSTGVRSQRAVISNNILRNSIGTHALQVNTAAIRVAGTSSTEDWKDVSIVDNVIESAYRAIRIDSALSGVIIKGNTIRTTTSDAIAATSTGDDLEIEGNHIYSPGILGIKISNPDRPRIINNLIDGAGDSGIWIDASASPIILGNRVRSSVNDGLFINNTLNSIIDGNNFSDNGRYGINLGGTSVNTPLGFTNVLTGNTTAPINGGTVPIAGTVTTVSVVTANGVSGSVATPTTTPAITLSLGAITPSSVTSSGVQQSGDKLHVAKDKPAAAGSNTAVWFTNAAVGLSYGEIAIKGYGAGNVASISIATGNAGDYVLLQTGGGKVAIGTTAPAAGAILDISSTAGALLVPRMTSTERDALTPTAGLVLWNSTTAKLQVYTGSAWADLH